MRSVQIPRGGEGVAQAELAVRLLREPVRRGDLTKGAVKAVRETAAKQSQQPVAGEDARAKQEQENGAGQGGGERVDGPPEQDGQYRAPPGGAYEIVQSSEFRQRRTVPARRLL